MPSIPESGVLAASRTPWSQRKRLTEQGKPRQPWHHTTEAGMDVHLTEQTIGQ